MPTYKRETKTKGTVWDVAIRVDGRQIWKRGFPTQKAARQAEAQMRTDSSRGVKVGASRLTVTRFIEDRYLPFVEERVEASTFANYKSTVGRIKTDLGEKRLDKVTPDDVMGFLSGLRREGLSGATRAKIFQRLRQCFTLAVRWGQVGYSPCTLVDAPPVTKHRPPEVTVGQIGLLVEAAESRGYGALVFMAFSTGMRWGELTNLRWRDVDIEAGRLRIRKSKTEAGIRSVAFGTETATVLEAHLMSQQAQALLWHRKWTQDELVFTTPIKGCQIQHGNWWHAVWVPVRNEAGLPTLHLHDARHTHATMLVSLNVHPRIAMERLGHANSRVTMEIYSHAAADEQMAAAAAVDNTLAGILVSKVDSKE